MDAPLIRLEDRFLADRMPEALRDALRRRRLPTPSWDRRARAWAWPDRPDAADAVRFLADAYGLGLDEAASEALGDAPDTASRLRALESRLRPYQRDGAAFLATQRRALLADGMGLGKSVQALTALERLDAYPAIVLAPASVKLGWQEEVLRWVPWRSVQVLMAGDDRLLDADMVVLNPELLPRAIESLLLLGPQAVVLDEAHMYKNPKAQRTQLVEDLVADVPIRFGLTGTPIPNRRPDILQQLELLGRLEDVIGIYRGVLPHYWRPGQPIQHDWALRALEKLPRREVAARLRSTCFLRRTKDQVHGELPPFHRTRRDLVLPDANPYRKQEQSFVDWVRAQRRGDDGAWAPDARLKGRQHLSTLRREAALAKIPMVVEWAQSLAGERAIYFAHHRVVAHALGQALPGSHPVITGEVPAAARQAIIASLGAHQGLVATMDSSGQGVDGMQLHARHVVFVELDWTPTKHEQCEGRLHRVGQKDRVEAWYFLAHDTIDQAMMRRLDEKWRDLQGVLEGDEEADRFVMDVMDRASRGVTGAGLWHGP